MWRWLSVLVCAVCLQGCSSDTTKTYRYPNQDNSAVLVIQIKNHGGAAGFVLNEVSLETAGGRTVKVRKLEHMSDTRGLWEDAQRVRLCYIGSMDRGAPHWSGEVDGKTYQIDFLDKRRDQPCP